MNLAFVTELFYPSIGGQEIRFEELGRELVSRGHEVHLYTIHTDTRSAAAENRGGIEVRRLCPTQRYKSRFFRRNALDIVRFSYALWNRRRELAGYDAVIFNIWPLLPQMVLGSALRSRCVIDICETRSGLLWKAVYRSLTRIPNCRLLGVNPDIVRQMVGAHGVDSNSCASIVSGVDLRAAGDPPFAKRREQILFFGRMASHKNPRLLVQAFDDSGIYQQGFRLHMAGGGPELDELRRGFAFAGVTYHGRVSEERKWELLRESSLLVMPSRREGFPRVVAEAACVGTPTLTMDYPDNGTSSVIRDYAIGKVCGADRVSLVNELRAYANGSSSYADISKHCIATARDQFSWDTVSEALVRFLRPKDN